MLAILTMQGVSLLTKLMLIATDKDCIFNKVEIDIHVTLEVYCSLYRIKRANSGLKERLCKCQHFSMAKQIG